MQQKLISKGIQCLIMRLRMVLLILKNSNFHPGFKKLQSNLTTATSSNGCTVGRAGIQLLVLIKPQN